MTTCCNNDDKTRRGAKRAVAFCRMAGEGIRSTRQKTLKTKKVQQQQLTGGGDRGNNNNSSFTSLLGNGQIIHGMSTLIHTTTDTTMTLLHLCRHTKRPRSRGPPAELCILFSIRRLQGGGAESCDFVLDCTVLL